MTIENRVAASVKAAVSALYGVEANDNLIQLQKTRKDFEGDITLVVFPFAKMAKKAPPMIGEEIGNYLQENVDDIAGFNVVQGFLNLVISDSYWMSFFNEIQNQDKFGFGEKSGITKMVEYSSPNTNKPLHVGHLRNNFLGYSVSEILKANGHEVVKVQIINDRGRHICMSMLAWQRWGNGATPASTGVKGDKFVGDYYVRFNTEYMKEAQAILEKWEAGDFGDASDEVQTKYQALKAVLSNEEKSAKDKAGAESAIKDLAKAATPIIAEVQQMLQRWEAKDPETVKLWETMNGWCYDGFKVTYDTMGVDFDKLYYESDTYLLGRDEVNQGLESGVFYQKEDGSVWCDLTDRKLDQKLVLRSDGTAVYMTQDIGTAILRFKDFPAISQQIYTVGNEQDYHFKVLFHILDKLGMEWAKECYHLSYGMVELRSGKMKSREGKTADADDLMHEMIAKSKETAEELGKLEGLTDAEKEEVYRKIGIGSIKYFMLRVDPKKSMLFEPEESIDFNGNTSAFISFAYVRTRSLLRKYQQPLNAEHAIDGLEPKEKDLIKMISEWPQTLKTAGDTYDPSGIANYCYELVRAYNAFWAAVQVLREPNEAIKNFRVALSTKVGQVVADGMGLLGIELPERM